MGTKIASSVIFIFIFDRGNFLGKRTLCDAYHKEYASR